MSDPPMIPMSKAITHAGMAGNTLLCNRCGSRQELTLPQPAESVVALMKAWARSHARCRGDHVAFRYGTTVEDWPLSDDTGASSKAIYRHMKMGPGFASDALRGAVPYPLDPDDFGRCYRLLAIAPIWRARIDEMAQHGAVWAALATSWDELSALFEEESPTGICPRLYARMKELST